MSEQKKFIGKCIYCGSAALPLTIEHPLPDALGGRIELEQASCMTCQCAINPWEQKILRETWGVARNKLKIHSARPKRKPANPLLIKPDGNIVDIPLGDAFTAIFCLIQ